MQHATLGINLASIVDKLTMDCFLEHHDITPKANRKMYPNVVFIF